MRIKITKTPGLAYPGLPGPTSVTEDVSVRVEVQMVGAMIAMVMAPDDDQLLFKLIPVEKQKDVLRKPWAMATAHAAHPDVAKVLSQAVAQSGLYVRAPTMELNCAVDRNGKLMYCFSVPVQTSPPAATPAQQKEADKPLPMTDATGAGIIQ